MGENPESGAKRERRRGPRRSVKAAAAALQSEQAVVATRVRDARRSMTMGGIRYVDVSTFLRQLIMLLEAGTPILKSLRSLAERGEKAAMRSLIADVADYVEMGNPLWQAFERYPRQFDTVFINLIRASEASGTLITVLQRVVLYRERREMLKKRVRGGMLYPVVLLCVCFGAILFIAKMVIPEFQSMFSDARMKMPWFSRAFIGAARGFGDYWWVGIVVLVALVAAYKLWYVRNPLRRLTADRIKLKLPVLGTILRKNAIVEFTRTMALLLKSGLSMMATLDLVRNAIHNRAMAETIQALRDSVERGEGLEQPLRAAEDIVPSVVADMLVTGEESGRLDGISEQIADTYEEEVDIALATLGEALQPILTVILGVLVVMVMLAVFVPLITMVDQLGAGGL